MKRFSRLAVSGLCLALAACGGSKESEEGSNDLAKSVVTSAVASATGLSVSTDDLPDFVVLPKDAKALHRMNMNDPSQKGGLLTVSTSMPPAEALAFYREVFAKQGLKVVMESATEEGALLTGLKEDEGKSLNVVVAPDDEGKTLVTLTHMLKLAEPAG